MKKLLNVLMLALSLNGYAYAVEQCSDINKQQKDVLQFSFDAGKSDGLGYALAVIAWKESTAGENVINAVSGDYGIYQGNVKTLCSQADVLHNNFACNKEVQRVIEDREHAVKHAIETLKYWKGYHSARTGAELSYEFMIRSYRKGFGFNENTAMEYWNDFRKKYFFLKNCKVLLF